MKTNMGKADKAIRLAIALTAFILYYSHFISGTFAIILMTISGVFILTSMIGFCPIYSVFKISSNKKVNKS
jgi:hypothetical protein